MLILSERLGYEHGSTVASASMRLARRSVLRIGPPLVLTPVHSISPMGLTMTDATLSDDAQAFRHRVFRRIARALDRGPDAPKPSVDLGYLPLGLNATKDVVEEYRAGFMTFMTSNWEGLSATFGLLADDYSRELFVNLLVFRAIGHDYVELFRDTEAYFASRHSSEAMPAEASEFSDVPGGQHLARFDVEIAGAHFKVDCLRANIFFSYLLKQYFLNRDGVRIEPAPGDHAVDAGACFGDTAVGFSAVVGPSGRVYCFDPLDVHLRILRSNIDRNGIGNVAVFPSGLGYRDVDGMPVQNQVNPGFDPAACPDQVPIRTLDSLVQEGRIERVDFIKMDIEGHELAALRGAEASIRRFRPKLAISLYHGWDDYIDIPRYIDSLGLGYRFYLENYTVSDGETVLYGVTDRGALP